MLPTEHFHDLKKPAPQQPAEPAEEPPAVTPPARKAVRIAAHVLIRTALRGWRGERHDVVGSTVPMQAPNPMRTAPGASHQPRKVTLSPSTR